MFLLFKFLDFCILIFQWVWSDKVSGARLWLSNLCPVRVTVSIPILSRSSSQRPWDPWCSVDLKFSDGRRTGSVCVYEDVHVPSNLWSSIFLWLWREKFPIIIDSSYKKATGRGFEPHLEHWRSCNSVVRVVVLWRLDVFSQPLVLFSSVLITVYVFNFIMDVFVLLANVLRTKSGAVPKSTGTVDVSLGVFFLAIFFLFRILSSLLLRILKKPGYCICRYSTVLDGSTRS